MSNNEFSFFVDKIVFNDGNEIILEENSTVVFVGPNNSGKSVVLKNIREKIINNPSTENAGIVVKNINISKRGNDDNFINFLKSFSEEKYGADSFKTYEGYQFSLHENNIRSYYNGYAEGIRELSNIFISFIDTQNRLGMVGPTNSIGFKEQPQHPIHFLYKDENLQDEINDYFKKSFGECLILNYRAGNQIPLHVGEKIEYTKENDRISNEYNEKLDKLPFLHEQGDGMKSFVGILLNMIISYKSVFLIDEPEAFLHPPQAKLLGKMLSQSLTKDKQVFISTHSEDFLKGLLDEKDSNVKIIRINREGNVNNICELDNEGVKDVWEDPILKYSNILSGLFHKKVIVCESDSDCKFYSAILDSICEERDDYTTDLLFVHCGGKDRVSTVVNALKKIGVPVSVIVDFDVLNNQNPLKGIVESLEIEWSSVESNWKLIKNSIDSKSVDNLRKDCLEKNIKDYIDGISNDIISVKDAKEIRKIIKVKSPWQIAKDDGKCSVPSGDPTSKFNELQEIFEKSGLFIVELGELERFVKSIGNHGPKWVNEVLETKDLASDSELEDARKFIEKIVFSE